MIHPIDRCDPLHIISTQNEKQQKNDAKRIRTILLIEPIDPNRPMGWIPPMWDKADDDGSQPSMWAMIN